jgi:hypothetical protein
MSESNNIITRYIKLLSSITDAPKEFLEASALYLLSTVIGRRWVFLSMPETSLLPNKGATGRLLNLWFIILGKSRVSRKTWGVISKVEDIIKEIAPERILSTSFTPEALITAMSDLSKGQTETVCTWISDECAWFFMSLKKHESYMATADDWLSRIYDGRTVSRQTKKAGLEKVVNPYLTCILASTLNLPRYFTVDAIEKGFMNRFIYIVKDKVDELKPLRTTPQTIEEEREINYIILVLKALLNKSEDIVIKFDIESKRLYDEFERSIENKINNSNLGVQEGYYGNLPNLVVRIACIHRIARLSPEEIERIKIGTYINKEDIEYGINYANRALEYFKKVIELTTEPASSEPTPTNEKDIDRVYNIIASCKEGVPRSLVTRRTKWTAKKVEDIVKTLVESRRIEIITRDTLGRPAFIYRTID